MGSGRGGEARKARRREARRQLNTTEETGLLTGLTAIGRYPRSSSSGPTRASVLLDAHCSLSTSPSPFPPPHLWLTGLLPLP